MLLLAVVSVLAVCQASLHSHSSDGLENHRAVLIQGVDQNNFFSLHQLNLDVWNINANKKEATACVDLDQYDFLTLLPEFHVSVLSESLQKQADSERSRLALKQNSILSGTDWFDDYHTYDETKAWYEQLVESHPSTMRLVPSIGRTHEGRDIFAVHVNMTPPRPEKKQIWIQGLIHAREWISGAVVQYISKKLADASQDASHRDAAADVEYIIIPIVNPDGYVFTWSSNRLWRKNRSPQIFGTGVDINRNFEAHWGKGGASKVPISDTYQGPSAASEPETRAIQTYYSLHRNIVGAIDWHCFSQLILYPYGWTSAPPPNIKAYEALSKIMAKELGKNGRRYVAQQSFQLYPTSGSATDWFVSCKVQKYEPLSIAIELPPTIAEGASGFILDPEYIRPTGQESWHALLQFARFATENASLKN